MAEPFLTIGIASYNYSKYLDKALEQIKKQKFRDFEVLYCDDGSTDDSVAKIKRFIETEKDIPIRLVAGEHEGLLANKNRIIDNARGKYLLICDADDFMADDCLEALCHAAQRENADCVIGGFCEISDEGKVLKRHIPNARSSKWLYTWHHGQIYRLDIVRQNGIRFERIPDDVFYLQKIHDACEKVCFVPEMVYMWCRHSSSTSSSYGLDADWHPVKLWREISGFISNFAEKRPSAEKINLDYYMYKWYYFNVIDLWREDNRQIRRDTKEMRAQMRKAVPDYGSIGSIGRIVRAGDTAFARAAVLICWLSERLHMTYLMIYARKLQNQFRSLQAKWRRQYVQ